MRVDFTTVQPILWSYAIDSISAHFAVFDFLPIGVGLDTLKCEIAILYNPIEMTQGPAYSGST